MALRIELVRDGDGVAADYINDGAVPLALTFWWNRSMRVVDAAGDVVKPGAGPVLPCGVAEDWQLLAVAWFRRQGTARASQPAPGPGACGGGDADGVARGRWGRRA